MITPATEHELSQAIAGATTGLRIIGGGTRSYGHARVEQTLSTANISGIELYEPGALTLVAKAGTPVDDIEKTLAAENQQLAFEPMDHRKLLGTVGTPTIGGVSAGNVSGPCRISAGAARDFLLGVRFVDGQGTLIKNGGRVMKNVTGYDLVKLMAGSHGTLGVLTEVSFKTLPAVETAAALKLHGLTVSDAVRAMSAALGSPFEVSGAAHVPTTDGATTYIRVQGFEKSVAYRAEQLREKLARFGEIEIDADFKSVQRIWADIRDVATFADKPFVARLSIKPSDAPKLEAVVTAFGPAHIMLDWGGGLVWIAADADELDQVQQGDTHGSTAWMQFLHQYCLTHGGHATCIKSPDSDTPVFQPQNSVVAQLNQSIRDRFDPRGIFNPSVMA